MPEASISVSERQTQTLKKLTETHRSLNERKVNVEAELKQARKNEENLLAEARKRFNLDTPEALRAEFTRRTEANEKMLSEYQASLTEIQANLESLAGAE